MIAKNSQQLDCNITIDDYFLAYLQAVRDVPGPPDALDWQILTVLKHHPGGITFNTLYKTFNKSQMTHTNSKYYRCISRLLERGFIEQSYNYKSWRIWGITPAGRAQVDSLNAAALQYLNKKTGP